MDPGKGIADRSRLCKGDRKNNGVLAAAASANRDDRSNNRDDRLVVLYDDPVLVYFDDTGAVVGDHLIEYLIYYAFILKTGEIVNFIEVERVHGIAGFVDTPDLNILGQMGPLLENVSVQHRYWI
jgi:hypothetical protein